MRITIDGRRPKFGLGSYPTIGLARARQLAQDAHRDVAEGKEPGVRAKRRQRLAEAARTLTLGQAIDDYLAKVARPYKNVRSDRIRQRALRTHFAPLHSRDVASITVADVAGILRPLAPETAIKSHTAIRAVFDYAATVLEPHGVRMVNPADPRRLRSLGWAPKSRSESKPHAAVHWRVMPEVVAELSRTDDVAATCALFIVATAVRAGTARLAKWSDFDLEKRTWTPPLADLKDGRHHQRPFIVPLNGVALDALERMRARSSSRYVFAKSGGGPIGDGDLTNLVRRLRLRHADWRDPDSERALHRSWISRVFSHLGRGQASRRQRSRGAVAWSQGPWRGRGPIHSHRPGRGASRAARCMVPSSPRRNGRSHNPVKATKAIGLYWTMICRTTI